MTSYCIFSCSLCAAGLEADPADDRYPLPESRGAPQRRFPLGRMCRCGTNDPRLQDGEGPMATARLPLCESAF